MTETITESQETFVVGLGASAGGLESLQKFFAATSDIPGMSFVVIQHLDPNHRSMMAELLAKHTAMPVVVAQHGEKIVANHVYLIQPQANLEIRDGRLVLTQRMDAPSRPNYPIDQFFRSLAHDRGERSAAIVLSGTGSDGSAGARAVRAAGGIVFAEDPTRAKFNGMPNSVIETRAVHFVLAAEEMPDELMRVIEGNNTPPSREALANILALISRTANIDFDAYKSSTLARRVERRQMTLGSKSLDDYADTLSQSEEERLILSADLLIGVTKFFRDEWVFEIFRDNLPGILERAIASRDRTLRVWVPGCSTGEEAYTIALLIREYLDHAGTTLNVKLFATDVNPTALQQAARGYFPRSIEPDVPADLLGRYFIERPDGYEITTGVREMIVFAPHNLLRDPPFTRVDLVSCRNLLIYFRAAAQERAIGIFEFALRNGGFLMLGASESLGPAASHFEPIDGKARLYYTTPKPGSLNPLSLDFESFQAERIEPQADKKASRFPVRAERSDMSLALESLLQWVGQPILVVNAHDELVFAFGVAAEFLAIPRGRAALTLRDLLPEDLGLVVGSALIRAREGGEVVLSNVPFKHRDEPVVSTIRVVQMLDGLYRAIVFDDLKRKLPPSETTDLAIDQAIQDRVRQLEFELLRARERLQATVEELEASNEELQATNEELVSSNEELQSTNEELQSLNEELHTVNAELQAKVHELGHLTDDLTNLLRSVDGGILFLDLECRIRRYNDHISDVIRIREQDLGRPIGELAHNMGGIDLEADSLRVIASFAGVERQAYLDDGRTVVVRIHPFRASGRRVEGVVISTIDISALAAANHRLELYSRIAEQSPALHLITDRQGFITFANPAFCQATNWIQEQLRGSDIRTYLSGRNGVDIGGQVRQAYDRGANWNGQLWLKTARTEPLLLQANVFPVRDEGGSLTNLVTTGMKLDVAGP